MPLNAVFLCDSSYETQNVKNINITHSPFSQAGGNPMCHNRNMHDLRSLILYKRSSRNKPRLQNRRKVYSANIWKPCPYLPYL